MDLNDFAEKFIASEISEEDYVNKHETSQRKIKSWYEIQPLMKDINNWKKLLEKLKQAGNRRRVLFESIGIGVNELSKIMCCGNSTIEDIIRSSNQKGGTSNRQFNEKTLAMFGIITRGTYKLIRFENIDFQWDNALFRLIEDDAIDSEQLVKEINIALVNNSRFLMGYVLRVRGKKLFLRFERKEGTVIIDVMNPDLDSFKIISEILIKINCEWYYFLTPTIYDNKEFLIFVGNSSESEMNELLEKDFVWVSNCYSLRSLVKMKI